MANDSKSKTGRHILHAHIISLICIYMLGLHIQLQFDSLNAALGLGLPQITTVLLTYHESN